MEQKRNAKCGMRKDPIFSTIRQILEARLSMQSTKRSAFERLQMRSEIADRMFFNVVPSYDEVTLQPRSILKGMEEDHKAAIEFLISKGCSRGILNVVLDLAAALKLKEGKYSVPRAKTIKALAMRMKKLATDIRAAELSHFLTIMNEKETGYADIDLGIEDAEERSRLFPFLALPKWLEKRAAIYELWSQLASDKIPPKDFGVARLGRACVALYVRYATSKTYFPEVSKLVESMGLGSFGDHKAKQLSREVKEFENNYPWSCGFLRSQFESLDPNPHNRKHAAPMK